MRDFVQFHLSVDRSHAIGQHLRACAECNARYHSTYRGKAGIPAIPELNVVQTESELSSL